MKKEEFLNQLERLLMDIPEGDRLDAIEYYYDYFDEAGAENEQKVIQELGSPEKVARTIKENMGLNNHSASRDYGAPEDYEETRGYEESRDYAGSQGYEGTQSYNQPEGKKIIWVLIIIIAILTFPLWIGIVAGLFGGTVGLLAGLFGIVVGLMGAGFGICVGGVACLTVGIMRLAVSPLEGVVTIGVGAILMAIGLLIVLLFAWLTFKWIPALFRTVIGWCKGLFHRS